MTGPAWPSIARRRLGAVRLTGFTRVAFLAVLVGLSLGGFLLSSNRLEGSGFPLDDAWIHQTYARNLGTRGEWAFVPGQPSAGSTAPLWTGLLALGYALRLPHLAWAYLLGASCLLGLALAGDALVRDLWPGSPNRFPWAALFLAGEWHLAWSSVSGMETLLAALLFLLTLRHAGRARGVGWLAVGLLIGASMWVRPDGVTLLGPAGLCLLANGCGWKDRLKSFLWMAAGVLLLAGPYLLFNQALAGSIWPNTFYAKQSEYAILRQAPLAGRIVRELSLPLMGGGSLLLPGFAWILWDALRNTGKQRLPAARDETGMVAHRDCHVLACAAWCIGYSLLYALRLPVTYQYGRYLMPAMPVYFVLGIAGCGLLLSRWRASRLAWLATRVWLLSAAGVWAGFYLIGAGRYAQDVAIIQTEMVAAAQWVSMNTTPEALIAAHDIGALGYFSNRRLVDLAGLVSPEVIPFIRDEERLAGWLDDQAADYLVVPAGWYQHLPGSRELVFQTPGIYAGQLGGANTQVYRWDR